MCNFRFNKHISHGKYEKLRKHFSILFGIYNFLIRFKHKKTILILGILNHIPKSRTQTNKQKLSTPSRQHDTVTSLRIQSEVEKGRSNNIRQRFDLCKKQNDRFRITRQDGKGKLGIQNLAQPPPKSTRLRPSTQTDTTPRPPCKLPLHPTVRSLTHSP